MAAGPARARTIRVSPAWTDTCQEFIRACQFTSAAPTKILLVVLRVRDDSFSILGSRSDSIGFQDYEQNTSYND